MSKLVGDERPSAEALKQMRESPYSFPDTFWATYQNHDLGHHGLGHLQFLAVGPQNTIKAAPGRMPDTERSLNWRYIHVGFVNLETGQIEPEPIVGRDEVRKGEAK